MRKITLELSSSSCNEAIKALVKYKKDTVRRLNEVCKQMAEVARQEAQRIFDQAASNVEEGNGGVYVTIEPIENGFKIVASGEDVYFIEFGTGNSAGMFYGDGLPVTSVPVYPGSYSERHAKIYAENGYWFFHGQIMSSTDTYMPMYYAGKKMREEFPKIVKEVFRKK